MRATIVKNYFKIFFVSEIREIVGFFSINWIFAFSNCSIIETGANQKLICCELWAFTAHVHTAYVIAVLWAAHTSKQRIKIIRLR